MTTVTRHQYLDETQYLKPISRIDNVLWWTEDYYIKGHLIRFSAMMSAEMITRTNMSAEENIDRE